MNRQRGMTIIELLVSITIVMIIIGAATTTYLKILRTYKTQGRLAEGYMANLTGLEMLRYDIETAGFGLPANLNTATYSEAVAVNPETNFNAASNPNPAPPYDPSLLNDSPSNPPRAFAQLDNQGPGIGGNHYSDVLSIKSSTANINATSKRWSMISTAPNFQDATNTNPKVKLWGGTQLDPVMDFTSGVPADNFIVLDNTGTLQLNGAQWLFTFNASLPNTGLYKNINSLPGLPSPGNLYVYFLYGLDNYTTGHRMPFNRVDYYLDRIASDFPSTCDPKTFTLYRSVIDQATGDLLIQTPLIDCVADFQVAFGLDPNGGTSTNGDPVAPTQWQANLSVAGVPMTAQQIQQQLREVRVFILYQEGLGATSKSPDFIFSGTLNLGDQAIANAIDPADYPNVPNNFTQLSPGPINGALNQFTPAGSDQQYRWKIIEMAVKPMNLLNLISGTQR
ncbi:MAG: prepilin-type N-terminal cleavage/methylation domain-containing protein [Syntrophobacteraceae bacterium]